MVALSAAALDGIPAVPGLPAPLVWVLHDGKAGMRSQALGLAEAAGFRFVEKRLSVLRPGLQPLAGAVALSGGLAGMVGINEVLGYRYRYYDGFSSGYGFTGIAVALLGRNHPVGVILAALLFGALLRGGLFVDIFTEHVSKDLVMVLQGIIILFVAAEALFKGPFGRRIKGV